MNIQACLQENIINIKECNQQVYTLGIVCIANLAFIIINFMAFILMIGAIDIIREYEPPLVDQNEI